MRASIVFIILSAASSFPAAAQIPGHEVVSPAGDIDRNDKIELAWTIGEVAVNGRINQQESITEGFHQPVLQVEWVTDDQTANELQPRVAVYPNPVSQQLHVEFGSPVSTGWMITLTAADGTRLSQQSFQPGSEQASLDVSVLPSGLYFLQLRSDDEKQLLQYKISKIQ